MKNQVLLSLLLFLPSTLSAFTLSHGGAWKVKTLRFHVDMTNCPASVADSLEKAFKLWNQVPTSSLKMERGSDTTVDSSNYQTTTTVPYVFCDPNFGTTFASDNVDADVVGGVGFSTSSGGTIAWGGLVLNAQANANANINNFGTTPIDILVAHEIGHVLGIGHSESDAALMYYSVGQKGELRLAQDDEDALSYQHPRDEFDTSQFMGCGWVDGKQPPGSAPLILSLFFLPLIIYKLMLPAKIEQNLS